MGPTVLAAAILLMPGAVTAQQTSSERTRFRDAERLFMLRSPDRSRPLLALVATSTSAQERPRPALEVFGGWAGFVDSPIVNHVAVGGNARFYLTPRLAVGPEIVYMSGPGDDRDVMVTGNLTFDLVRPGPTGPPRITPFLVAGGGFFQHTERVGTGDFTSREGAFTTGGGVRVFVTDNLYVSPEVRIGWELHIRTSFALGLQFGR